MVGNDDESLWQRLCVPQSIAPVGPLGQAQPLPQRQQPTRVLIRRIPKSTVDMTHRREPGHLKVTRGTGRMSRSLVQRQFTGTSTGRNEHLGFIAWQGSREEITLSHHFHVQRMSEGDNRLRHRGELQMLIHVGHE